MSLDFLDDDDDKVSVTIFGIDKTAGKWFSATVLGGELGKDLKECDKIVESLLKDEQFTFKHPIEKVDEMKMQLRQFGFIFEQKEPEVVAVQPESPIENGESDDKSFEVTFEIKSE